MVRLILVALLLSGCGVSNTYIYVDKEGVTPITLPIAVIKSTTQGDRQVEFDADGKITKITDNSKGEPLLSKVTETVGPALLLGALNA